MAATDVFHLGLMAELNDASNDEDAPEVAFYTDLVRRSGGPALDAGCGPGRLLRACLAEGIDIEGSDVSPDMLSICRRRCQEAGLEPVLHQGSTGELDLPRRFRTVVMSGSFGLNGTRDDDLAALRRVHDHLLPGGTLAFDAGPGWANARVWALYAAEDLELPSPWREGGTTLTRDGRAIAADTRDVAVDPIEQSVTTDVRCRLVVDGRAVVTEVHRLVDRWYGVHELVALLERTGFADVAFTERRGWFGYPRPTFVYTARRP